MFWEWDWDWFLFSGYALGCFIFGMLCSFTGIPGIVPIVIGAIVGACAGSWDWFENHAGNNDY